MSYLELEPARAKGGRSSELWEDPLWIAEEKLDGWRFLLHFGGDLDRIYLTGRRISRNTGRFSEKGLCAPMLCPVIEKIGYTVIDGEVMAPEGASFRDIASIMNVSPGRARARAGEIGEPRYFAFDLLYVDGLDVRDKPQMERRSWLDHILKNDANPLVRLVPIESVDKLSYYDSIIAKGGEGVILKDFTASYGEGWIKVKKYSTLDVVVTGFTDAREGVTGKYLGQIGAAKVSVYSTQGQLLEVGRVSGMTDEVRLDMSQNPKRWIGSVIEIAAQEFAKERLRHPRFLRPRFDADPKSATFAKMMADLQMSGLYGAEQLSLPFSEVK